MESEIMHRVAAMALLLGGCVRGEPGCSEAVHYVYKIAFYGGGQGSGDRPKAFGAGIFLPDHATFLTARHVFEEALGATSAVVEVVENGKWYACPVERVIASSRALDIVRVRVRLDSHKVSAPRRAERAQVGETVQGFRVPPPFAAVWHPFTGIVCTEGVVSAAAAEAIEIRGQQFLVTGSSGSPIFNSAGEVVGIALEMINGNSGNGPPDWTYRGLPIGAALSAPSLPVSRALADFLAGVRGER